MFGWGLCQPIKRQSLVIASSDFWVETLLLWFQLVLSLFLLKRLIQHSMCIIFPAVSPFLCFTGKESFFNWEKERKQGQRVRRAFQIMELLLSMHVLLSLRPTSYYFTHFSSSSLSLSLSLMYIYMYIHLAILLKCERNTWVGFKWEQLYPRWAAQHPALDPGKLYYLRYPLWKHCSIHFCSMHWNH